MTAELILLPGLLNDARLWSHQVAALAALTRVRVVSTADHGSVADIARAVLAQVRGRFAVAGLSMGGYVAMEILRQAPDRVERLALVSTTARPDTPEQGERRRAMVDMARAGKLDRLVSAMLPGMVHPDHLASPVVGGLFVDMAAAVGADGFIRQQEAIMARPDSRPDLAAIRCPTVVLVGADDGLTPPERAHEMVELIPGARLGVIGQCGHLSAIEQPQAVSVALALWLQGDG